MSAKGKGKTCSLASPLHSQKNLFVKGAPCDGVKNMDSPCLFAGGNGPPGFRSDKSSGAGHLLDNRNWGTRSYSRGGAGVAQSQRVFRRFRCNNYNCRLSRSCYRVVNGKKLFQSSKNLVLRGRAELVSDPVHGLNRAFLTVYGQFAAQLGNMHPHRIR